MAKDKDDNQTAAFLAVGQIVQYRTPEKQRPLPRVEPTEEDPDPKQPDPEIIPSETLPAVITQVHSETCVNLKVLHNGSDPQVSFRTSVQKGTAPNTFSV